MHVEKHYYGILVRKYTHVHVFSFLLFLLQLPTLLQESSTFMTPHQLEQWQTKLQAFCDEHNATTPTFFLPLHTPTVQLASRISNLISLPHSCSAVLLAGVDNPEPLVRMVGLNSAMDVIRPSQLPCTLPSSSCPGENRASQPYPARLTLPNFKQALKSIYIMAGTKVLGKSTPCCTQKDWEREGEGVGE